MKRIITVIAAVTILTVPVLCTAAPARPGTYMSGFLGVSVPQNADVTSTDFTGQTFEDRVEFDPGVGIGGTLGYDFGFLRMEGELSYKHSEINSIADKSNGLRFRNVDGGLGVFAMMGNAFFDIHNASPITPYFGGGIGFATLYLSDTFGTDISAGTPRRVLLYPGDNDTVFAYQAGAGIEIALNRQLSLDIGYRYFGTSKARFGQDLDIMTELKTESHNGVVGFRVRF